SAPDASLSRPPGAAAPLAKRATPSRSAPTPPGSARSDRRRQSDARPLSAGRIRFPRPSPLGPYLAPYLNERTQGTQSRPKPPSPEASAEGPAEWRIASCSARRKDQLFQQLRSERGAARTTPRFPSPKRRRRARE